MSSANDVCRECRINPVTFEDPDRICPECTKELNATWHKMDLYLLESDL